MAGRNAAMGLLRESLRWSVAIDYGISRPFGMAKLLVKCGFGWNVFMRIP